jgi:hypothetical protein
LYIEGAVAKRKLLQLLLYAQNADANREREPFCGKTADKNQQPGSKTCRFVESYSIFVVVKP